MLEKVDSRKQKKGYRFICRDINTNSKLYRKEDELNKYPNFKFIKPENLEQILNYIHDEQVDCCVEVKRLLYRGEKLVGYTMKFYEDYRSLKQSLSKKLSLKKDDCYKILKIFKKLNEKNLYCDDVHLSNFLINKDNCLMCDLDSLKFSEDNYVKDTQSKKAIKLCLGYLYGIEPVDVTVLFRDCYEWIIDDKPINDIVRNITDENLLHFQEIIKKIRPQEVKRTKSELKVKIREIRNNPYYRGYYEY